MRILYLTHDLSDTTTAKRVRMLIAGGATVTLAGFTRDEAVSDVAGVKAVTLGRTYNNRFLQRITAVLKSVTLVGEHKQLFADADLILARNLETMAIAVRGRVNQTPIVYEVLDIHRLLLRTDAIGHALRVLEGWLTRRACLVITSSPAFVREYFERRSEVRLPTLLVENKVFDADSALMPAPAARDIGPPWRIGWFGAIRCKKSLDILCDVASKNPGLVEVIIRGRVSHDQIPEFAAKVARTPGISFHGPYRNPDGLAEIYGDVHFSWAIDMFEEGLNSAWLLPNRIYEGGLYGAVPLAASGVETARYISELNIGHTLSEPKTDSLTHFLKSLSAEIYTQLQSAVATLPRSHWVSDVADCRAIVSRMAECAKPQTKTHAPLIEAPEGTPALVVIPCLNESTHLKSLVSYLLNESETTPMRIVIADGGSTDGTVDIAKSLDEAHENVTYLHNPKRIQSAAINLAVQQFGDTHRFLIRIDAHADYPHGYCRALIEEARITGADSVVVTMLTVGKTPFQQAVAAAQNSKLGNGGSAHRSTLTEGKFVEHGHHALMRIAAYRAVGGYDETFSHNEDAELDTRLRNAGHRIWLTARTTLTYYPRATALPLFRQYRGYGRGRARTLLRHRETPKLRQMIPVGVAPAIVLFFLSPFTYGVFALPALAWGGICLAYGWQLSRKAGDPALALSGPAAMLMHAGWSLGFWQGMLDYLKGKR